MHQLSSDTSTVFCDRPDNFDDPAGTANTLKRAMTINKMSDMIDCIKDMKLYANTIENDLNAIHIDRQTEIHTMEFKTDDFIQQAKQRVNDNHYILLNDLIEQKNKSNESHSKMNNPRKSLLGKQVEYMKHVIAAQPSALEAIYLEALLNPDQWQYNHHLLQTSPMDILTSSERKRLNKILNKIYPYKP